MITGIPGKDPRTSPNPKVVYAERVGDDVVVEFDEGECALYPAFLLHSVLPQAVTIECPADEGAESEPYCMTHAHP